MSAVTNGEEIVAVEGLVLVYMDAGYRVDLSLFSRSIVSRMDVALS